MKYGNNYHTYVGNTCVVFFMDYCRHRVPAPKA